VDPAEYRQRSHSIWEAMAKGWLREREYMWGVSRPVGEDMVAKLDPKPGQTILELAAGIGDTGFLAARALGDEGRLISTDFSEQMVDGALQHGEELGLTNVEYLVMDAERMPLENDSVDGVLCRWGYMLMAEPEMAFAETRRVLRDGGRLVLSVWGEAPRNPWGAMAGAALVQDGHMERPEPDAPGIFSMADPERIRSLVTAAGFADPQVDEVAVQYRFEDFEDYWRFLTEMAGGIAMVVKRLSDDDRESVRDQLRGWSAGFQGDGGLVMPGVVLDAVTT
jgi:ubiquinone/menaquinone biosynthesis C-methylase UbiE